MSALEQYQLFIDGQWCDGAKGQTLNSIDPSTGDVWANFACAAEDDVNRAVSAATCFKRSRLAQHHANGTRQNVVPACRSH